MMSDLVHVEAFKDFGTEVSAADLYVIAAEAVTTMDSNGAQNDGDDDGGSNVADPTILPGRNAGSSRSRRGLRVPLVGLSQDFGTEVSAADLYVIAAEALTMMDSNGAQSNGDVGGRIVFAD